jgi:transcriptional regulator with XRE-family HTH domain
MKPTHPLTTWRRQRGWTQAQLAKAADLSQGYITNIETYKRTPAGNALEALLDVTGLPCEALALPLRYLRRIGVR